MKNVKALTGKMVLFVGLPIASVMKVTANYPVAFSATKLAQSVEEYCTMMGKFTFPGKPSDPETFESIEKKLDDMGIVIFRVSGVAENERDYIGTASTPVMGVISKQEIEASIARSIEIMKKLVDFKPKDIQYFILEDESE